jgi:hypothetical protein
VAELPSNWRIIEGSKNLQPELLGSSQNREPLRLVVRNDSLPKAKAGENLSFRLWDALCRKLSFFDQLVLESGQLYTGPFGYIPSAEIYLVKSEGEHD